MVYELNLFYNLGAGGCGRVCHLMQCLQMEARFSKCFCLGTEAFAKRSIRELGITTLTSSILMAAEYVVVTPLPSSLSFFLVSLLLYGLLLQFYPGGLELVILHGYPLW